MALVRTIVFWNGLWDVGFLFETFNLGFGAFSASQRSFVCLLS